MEWFYIRKTGAWKKHLHALHSWALRLVCNQTNPLVMKPMTDLEDKTDHLQVFKNSFTSPQEWTVGLVPMFLFARSGLRSHSCQRCTVVLQKWMNHGRVQQEIGEENKSNSSNDYESAFLVLFAQGTCSTPSLHLLCPQQLLHPNQLCLFTPFLFSV